MQNNITTVQKNSNIINLQSEILFREAEDCFLYFNEIKKAIKKLNEAIKISPFHHKSLTLKGDICFITGKIDEALGLYKRAEFCSKNDSRILACIATCLETKEDYLNALSYCDKAFLFINEYNCQIYLSLYELKTSILLKLKRYEQAKRFINKAKYDLSFDEITALKSHKEIINLKLKLKNKLKVNNLKVLST